MPLAHVSLRARAWGIPNVGLKDARARHGALAGKTVWFEATAAGHTLREATAEEVAAWQARQRDARQVVLPAAASSGRGPRPARRPRWRASRRG